MKPFAGKLKNGFFAAALLTSSLNAAVVVETRDEQVSNADLVLGQSSKKLYGRFLGKNVTVHQYTQVYGIPFAPEMNSAIARRGR